MPEIIPLEQMLKALGEPTRFKIYSLLLERRHCVRSLSGQLGISESAVSQHIKVLRQAGLVRGEQFGYHTHYTPVSESLGLLTGQFSRMTEQAEALAQTGNDHRCACHAGGHSPHNAKPEGCCPSGSQLPCCRKEVQNEPVC